LGDGIAGFIWKGESNGEQGKTRIWTPDWSTATANYVTPYRTYPPDFDAALEFDIMTYGDFNGDGDADWLWRARANGDGRWRVWQIQDGGRAAQNTPPAFDAAHEWTVAGVGDTDGDGDDDVVLYKASTGEIMVWEMQNHAIAATHAVGTKAGYAVDRIGDFDNDGDADLLLRLVGGDTQRMWNLENNAFVAEINFANPGTGYVSQCVGDFDGDGDSDVFLVDNSGNTKWANIQNFVRASQPFGANQSAWILLGCADYDGDGTSDMLWTSADGLGQNRITIMQNFASVKTYYTNKYAGTDPSSPGYGFEYRGSGN